MRSSSAFYIASSPFSERIAFSLIYTQALQDRGGEDGNSHYYGSFVI